jgi:hypothetical protein
MGTFLLKNEREEDENVVAGDSSTLQIMRRDESPVLTCVHVRENDTVYYCLSHIVNSMNMAVNLIYTTDYRTWHNRFGHPSKEVFATCQNTL